MRDGGGHADPEVDPLSSRSGAHPLIDELASIRLDRPKASEVVSRHRGCSQIDVCADNVRSAGEGRNAAHA